MEQTIIQGSKILKNAGNFICSLIVGAGIDCSTMAESCRAGDVFAWPLTRWEEERWWQSLKQSGGIWELLELRQGRNVLQGKVMHREVGPNSWMAGERWYLHFFLETCCLQEWRSANGAGSVSFWSQWTLPSWSTSIHTDGETKAV